MSLFSRRSAALLLGLTLGTASLPAHAAKDKKQCAISANHGQELRTQHKFLEARAEFVRCASDGCPSVVAKDCGQWLAEIEQRIPTVAFSATDALGKDVVGLKVSVDGAPLDLGVAGTAVQLDPGPHKVRYLAAGMAPLEEDLIVVEGEHARSVRVKLGAKAEAVMPPDEPPAPIEKKGTHISPAVYVLGGVGALGLLSFTLLALRGSSDYSDAEARCSPRCTASDTSAIKTEFAIADISLGIGIASLAAAGIVLAINLSESPKADAPPAKSDLKATALRFEPRASGGVLGLSGTF